jgi:hypothetical protein
MLIGLVTEAMILVASVVIILVLILVLILPTIGGVEIGVESILTTIQLAPPILCVFTDYLILASATLGVVIIRWDANNILGIDLDNHGVTSVCISKMRKIGNRAEVQSA